MFYEINQYRVIPGKMDAWLQLMEEEFIPFAAEHGLNSVGSFRDAYDTTHTWIRRFDSEEELERVHAAVYGSDFYKNEIEARLPKLIMKGGYISQRIIPTPNSGLK